MCTYTYVHLILISSTVQYGDTTHTFIERVTYNGIFLPGFREPMFEDKLLKTL